jgi:diguanylate cyclase (GGDEF)-like protein
VVLDNLTLLFSLALTSGLMALSLAVTSRQGQRDGLRLWAAALACESLTWVLGSMREVIPEFLSLLLANLFLTTAQAIKLGAVYEYRALPWPRWQSLLPILAMLLLLAVLPVEDFRGRLIYGSLIYAAQFAMLARALRFEKAARSGAWWLIYGATLAVLPILALRFAFALHSTGDLAPQFSSSPNTMQVMVFVGLIALNLLGALGFILLGKERAEREIRKLAMIDGLTGILNRRAFMDRAEQELAGALRKRQPLSLLMFDIDHFKRINDEYGHAAGDMVLVEISRLLAQRLRKQDSFGRYGGEEFCILLPATEAAGAHALAEKLRQAVAAKQLAVGEASVSVTISIGIGVCQTSCADCHVDFNRILKDADRALYQSKAEGRNRVVSLPLGCAPVPA